MLTISDHIGSSPKDVAAQMRKDLKSELEATGKRWHQEFLPKHFEFSAGQRYGYKPRTREYMIRKAKVKHHQRPLVWSGRTETAMRQHARVSVVKSTVKVTMTAAKYLNIRRSDAAPKMAEEVVANNPAELAELQRAFASRLTIKMNSSYRQALTASADELMRRN